MVQQLLASRIKRHARKRRVDRPQHHKGPNSRCHALVPDGFRLLIALIRQHPVVIQNRVVFFVDGPRQLRPGRIQGIDAAEAQRAIAARSSIELGNGYGHGRVRGVRRGSADGKGNRTRVVQKIGFRYAAGRYADRGFIAAGSKGITGFRKLDIGIGRESADGALAGFSQTVWPFCVIVVTICSLALLRFTALLFSAIPPILKDWLAGIVSMPSSRSSNVEARTYRS